MFKYAEGYKSKLTLRDTQRAIKIVKDAFQVELAEVLNLERVTAPVIVKSGLGVNDDLNGVERFVSFDLKNADGRVEVVHSLAKWKRMALKKYGYLPGEGIYTDMNALRRDDDMDNIHSIFVDQWDWEKIITKEQRTVEYLKETVRKIVGVIADVSEKIAKIYPQLNAFVERNVYFITADELLATYPELTAKQREYEITKKYKSVFIMQIGGKLKDGTKHDGRAPDYDDWTLNGDILVWNDVLKEQLELSSMGIRVDKNAMLKQLKESGKEDRKSLAYHSGVINEELPLTVGGGIGQSRLCMFLLQKLHIGEVQVSVWDEETVAKATEKAVEIL